MDAHIHSKIRTQVTVKCCGSFDAQNGDLWKIQWTHCIYSKFKDFGGCFDTPYSVYNIE